FEFYVLGRMESHTGSDFRSPVRTDKSRRYQQFRFLEHTMLIGPSGPTHEVISPVDGPMPSKLVPGPTELAPGMDMLPGPKSAPIGQLPASLSGLEGGAPVTVTPADPRDFHSQGAIPGSSTSSQAPAKAVSRWNR
ncbi:MAG: hypothetical protein SNJ82_09600, partial [Gemmataceae bacterium]